jgi:hypothetical protein
MSATAPWGAVLGSVLALRLLLLEETSRDLFKPFVWDLVGAVEDATQDQLFHRLVKSVTVSMG